MVMGALRVAPQGRVRTSRRQEQAVAVV